MREFGWIGFTFTGGKMVDFVFWMYDRYLLIYTRYLLNIYMVLMS